MKLKPIVDPIRPNPPFGYLHTGRISHYFVRLVNQLQPYICLHFPFFFVVLLPRVNSRNVVDRFFRKAKNDGGNCCLVSVDSVG